MTKYIWLGATVAVGIVMAGTYRLGYSNGSDIMELAHKRQVADLTDQLQRINYEADKTAYSSDMDTVNAKLAELFGSQDPTLSACTKLCSNSVQSEGGRDKRLNETLDTELLPKIRNTEDISPYMGYFDDPVDAGSIRTDTH